MADNLRVRSRAKLGAACTGSNHLNACASAFRRRASGVQGNYGLAVSSVTLCFAKTGSGDYSIDDSVHGRLGPMSFDFTRGAADVHCV